jgi:dolichyl-phosphate beta-glucosyltransferase
MSGDSIGLSVVLPMRDQARAVRQTLESVHAHLLARKRGAWEILVVGDGGDGEACRQVVDFARTRPGILLLRNPGPIGCGYAARHGILLARGERVLLIGPELAAPASFIDAMEVILERGHDLVVASRRTAQVRPLPPVRIRSEILSRSVDLSIQLLARRRALHSPVLFHLYRRQAAIEIFRRQKLDGPNFAVEILYLARRYSYSVIELPIPDSDQSLPAEDAWSDSTRGLGELLRIRMNRLRGDYG